MNSTRICLKENLSRQYSKVQVLSATPIQLEIYAEQLILVQMILHLDVNSEYKVKVWSSVSFANARVHSLFSILILISRLLFAWMDGTSSSLISPFSRAW